MVKAGLVAYARGNYYSRAKCWGFLVSVTVAGPGNTNASSEKENGHKMGNPPG
jgi:hypothetical protein